MRSKCLVLLIFLFIGIICTAEAQDKEVSRNVLDYYRSSISFDKPTLAKLESEIVVKDLKNGYLKIENEHYVNEVVLFGANSAEPFIIVVTHYCDPICNSELRASIFSLEDSKVKSFGADDEILPRLSTRENLEILNSKRSKGNTNAKNIFVVYEISQGGKVIKVKGSDTGESYLKLYEMHLDNDMFVVVKKR